MRVPAHASTLRGGTSYDMGRMRVQTEGSREGCRRGVQTCTSCTSCTVSSGTARREEELSRRDAGPPRSPGPAAAEEELEAVVVEVPRSGEEPGGGAARAMYANARAEVE